MIESILLRNFQCHRKKRIDFDPISVIVGGNGAGKTAILRGLLWAMFNEWPGPADSFISWGEDSAEVVLGVDGHKIIRSKGKELNLYILDEEEYRAFHPNVPRAIADLLNLSQDSVQNQQDPAFWLSLTSGQAATALNEIFSLGAIDTALSNVASEVRSAKERVGLTQERLEEAQQRIESLAWVKPLDKKLRKAEEISEKISEAKRQREEMKARLKERTKAEWVLEKADSLLVKYNQALSLARKMQDLDREIKEERSLLEEHERLISIQNSLRKKEARLCLIRKGRCPLCGKE